MSKFVGKCRTWNPIRASCPSPCEAAMCNTRWLCPLMRATLKLTLYQLSSTRSTVVLPTDSAASNSPSQRLAEGCCSMSVRSRSTVRDPSPLPSRQKHSATAINTRELILKCFCFDRS